MARQWIKTNYPGVRYREHTSRKHNGRPDRYFSIRHCVNYKKIEEGLGWASEGWNAEKAHKVLAKVREGIRTGEGAQSLAEMRTGAEAARQAEAQEARLAELRKITLEEFFNDHYLPHAQKTKRTWRDDQYRIDKRIIPRIGKLPLCAITRDDARDFLESVRAEGVSEATALHYMAILRRAYNLARVTLVEGESLFTGQSPIEGLKLPKAMTARERFLNYDEADALIEAALKSGHQDLHAAIVIALNTGLRLGELLRLEWPDVNLTYGIITVRDEVSRKPGGKVFINADVDAVLKESFSRRGECPLVIPPPNGAKERRTIARRYSDLVEEIGFNDYVTDVRHKVVFHTLRHTFASWLALAGTDIYRIKSLMRHKTITMTMRYAHLIPDATRSAVNNLRPARAKSTVS